MSVKDRLELCHDLGTVEADKLDPLSATAPLDLGQERQQRMSSMELIAPIGDDEGNPAHAESSDQKVQQLQRRAVRPMKILGDKEDRGRFGDSEQEPEEMLEQPD